MFVFVNLMKVIFKIGALFCIVLLAQGAQYFSAVSSSNVMALEQWAGDDTDKLAALSSYRRVCHESESINYKDVFELVVSGNFGIFDSGECANRNEMPEISRVLNGTEGMIEVIAPLKWLKRGNDYETSLHFPGY